MFRGSKLGTIAISAFEKLVLNIFQNIEKSSNNSYKSIPLPELREIVKRSLKMAPFTEVSPTPTLISKIIMGVFCRTIAEDRYAKKGLKKFQEQNPKLHPLKGNLKSIDWDSISKCEPLAKRFATLTPTFFGTKEKYPLIRAFDIYLWFIGEEIARTEDEQRKNKKQSMIGK